MSEIEVKDIAIVISGAITAVSTLGAVLITNYFNGNAAKLNQEAIEKQARLNLKTSKLEELYLLFEKWESNASNVYLMHIPFYKGEMSLDAVRKMVLDKNNLEFGEAQKLSMLLHVHFPELVKEYELVEDARNNLVPYLAGNGKNNLTLDSFCKKQEDFDKQCKAFKIKLSTRVREL